MNYAQIRQFDIANGIGIRTSVFFSGCTHNCPSCFNKEYQNFKYGNEWNPLIEDKVVNLVSSPNIKGLSLLGGEPFQQDPKALCSLLKRVKIELNKDIWLWTGYTFEQIPEPYKTTLKYIDVIVDGKFKEELKSAKLRFKGSKNQRIIDVQKTLKQNQIILFLN